MPPAPVKIYIQAGTGNTQYNGPVQINNYAAPLRPLLTCYICGGRDEAVRDRWYGNCHPECERQGRIDAKRHAADMLHQQLIDARDHPWQVVASTPSVLIDQAPEPLQIAAPVEREAILVRDDPGKYADMQRPYHIPLVRKL
jgi:hypothetical protein